MRHALKLQEPHFVEVWAGMGERSSPSSSEGSRRLNSEGGNDPGYDPGDAYGLWVDEDGRKDEW